MARTSAMLDTEVKFFHAFQPPRLLADWFRNPSEPQDRGVVGAHHDAWLRSQQIMAKIF
jgi:hypothetical protein